MSLGYNHIFSNVLKESFFSGKIIKLIEAKKLR